MAQITWWHLALGHVHSGAGIERAALVLSYEHWGIAFWYVWLYKLAFVPVEFGDRYVIIPVGSTVEIMQGNKIVLNADDRVKVDCSVADKVSVTMSYMEIT